MGRLLNDISNFVNKQLGLPELPDFLGTNSTNSAEFEPPWIRDPSNKDEVFWRPILLDPKRWNKLYPYRLLVVDVSKPGIPRVVSGRGNARGKTAVTSTPGQGIEYIITQVAEPGAWEMVLPITPQQLSIQDQYSINTTATMRGILEEHNGLKFKMINIAGTTGIWPKRPTKGGTIKQPTALGSLFGGTLEGIGNLARNVQGVVSSFNGEHPNKASDAIKPENSEASEFSTGYYQAMYLGQFLERYAQAKKNPKNKGWRLVFDMPKQNQSFVVTPQAFNMNQNKQHPMEMLFTIQLKAWKRIELKQNIQPASSELPSLDPNLFQTIVNTIEQTRRTLSSATNLIKAVRSDSQKPFSILRQTSLMVKDTAGLAYAVGDLPRNIINDSKDSIQDSWINASSAFNRGLGNQGASAGSGSGSTISDPLINRTTSSSEKAGVVVDGVMARNRVHEGLSRDAVMNGALGNEASQQLETDSLNNVFANPEENFDLFNEISTDDLILTNEQQDAIDDELERVRLLTINDLREFRAELLSLALDISDNYGAGDETYSSIYGLPDPKERALDLTIEENEVIAAIFESIQAYDMLTATKAYDDLNIENPLEYVGGLANEAGIDFQDYPSKILAPVPFGSTIEEIAARYMDDADRWVEIVTLNKLRSPYIDEEGFYLDLLSNADGRQFNVDDSNNQLYVGQTIILQSDIIPQFTRRIINIEKIGDNNYLVTVDGLANLETLTTSDSAKIQAFLPGTVNSQNQIYIPVNLPSAEDDRTFEIPSLDNQNLTKLSKIDFLLTDNFDIAINSVGDFRLANGLTNLIQALKMKIKVQKGTLLRHLDYGLGLEHGVSVADINSGEIINAMNEMIKDDPRFDFIESVSFKLNGSTLGIDMSVRLANDTGVLPINFDTNLT